MAKGVWQIVQDLKAAARGHLEPDRPTARIFSKPRFPMPIIALSSDHRALRRMAMHYGVIPRRWRRRAMRLIWSSRSMN